MKPEDVLYVVLDQMSQYAEGWRWDWSDFDGRTLRNQLSDLRLWAREALGDITTEEYRKGEEFYMDKTRR